MRNTTELPPIKEFYSSLSEQAITHEAHAFASKVWKTFGCKNLLDYTEIYCKIDTILLAEIFQKFRKDMLTFSSLDPARYISLPSFAFDSMLKITKCKIELPQDIDIIQFIESGIRGGVSFINTRHLKVNNPSKEKIVYIDANNLYGLSQVSKLPIGRLKWMTKEKIQKINWAKIDTETNTGFILEVDLEYPKRLHLSHNNFPLAPENVVITSKNLSPYATQSLLECSQSNKYKDTKLTSTFHNRKNYVLHFKNLKLYLNLGMKLLKVHRVLKFKQENFIAPFIEKCTQARQMSKNKFEQDQFKKLANSTYGKTIQNVRNYLKVRLHTNQKSLQLSVNLPTFKHFVIIDENLVQTNHFPPVIVHDKPVFIGFTILELSKHFMFDFFYNKLCRNCPSTIDLGFSDTDSFLFKIDKPKKFLQHIKPHLDFSNFSNTHELFTNSNKAKLGFFKDELTDRFICKEFIGLRSKCYALNLKKQHDNTVTEKKVCKGLGRVAIQNRLQFKHYRQCLFQNRAKRFHFNSIRSTKQNVSTVRLNKKALSHFDSKRWLFNCGIHSAPYGSCLIKENFDKCTQCK